MLQTTVNNYKQLIKRASTFLPLILIFNYPTMGYTDNAVSALLRPDAPPPYANVFNLIEEGITGELNRTIDIYNIDLKNLENDISNAITNNKYQKIIALSPLIANPITKSYKDGTVLSGAIGSPPNKLGENGVSLYIHPKYYFKQLKLLSPSTRRVRVIMNPDHGKYHPQVAMNAAKEFGIELKIYMASDLREVAIESENLFSESDPKYDAVWITRDTLAFNYELMLSYHIEKSWELGIITFSNSPTDAKRGILFTLYPDYKELGKQLGTLLKMDENNTNKKSTSRLSYLNNPKLAINRRTAKHLGLNIDTELMLTADVEFPSK